MAVADGPVDFDLMLSGAAGLAGTVLAAPGNRPLPGALVIATDVRGDVVASGTADGSGDFGFGDLVPGNYTLAVSAGGHRPTAVPVEVVSGSANRYEVRLDPGARVQGTIRNSAGEPLDDARVTLLDAAGNTVGSTITGTDGVYTFNDLDTGDYTVVASGYAPSAHSLLVDRKGGQDLDLDLSH